MRVNFVPLTWEDYPSEDTPINATNLNRLEQALAGLYGDFADAGIDTINSRITTLETNYGALVPTICEFTHDGNGTVFFSQASN